MAGRRDEDLDELLLRLHLLLFLFFVLLFLSLFGLGFGRFQSGQGLFFRLPADLFRDFLILFHEKLLLQPYGRCFFRGLHMNGCLFVYFALIIARRPGFVKRFSRETSSFSHTKNPAASRRGA